jgi:hypothetical protein
MTTVFAAAVPPSLQAGAGGVGPLSHPKDERRAVTNPTTNAPRPVMDFLFMASRWYSNFAIDDGLRPRRGRAPQRLPVAEDASCG